MRRQRKIPRYKKPVVDVGVVPKAIRLNPDKNICKVDVEGVIYVIDWDKFPVHGFVFIKCIDLAKVAQKVTKHSFKYGIKVMVKSGIRNGYWGVGIWRTA
jgi:hypothetical protein